MLFAACTLVGARRSSMVVMISCAPGGVLMFRMRPLEEEARTGSTDRLHDEFPVKN